jgi:hypothetical protein
MPYEVAIPVVQDALEALLENDTPLGALIATRPTARGGGPAIYTDGDVPQGATMPYLAIGAWTQVGLHNLAPDTSGYGWNCTVQIKAIGQRSQVLYDVMSAVFELVPQGQALAVTGYSQSWCDEVTLHPMLKTTLAGVTTFELPAILRIYVS